MPDPCCLLELIEPPISGYWGAATPTTEQCWPARVVRNGDIRKDGIINVNALPIRWFSRRELEKAQLSRTDSVLVSSGAYTGNVGKLSNLDPKLPVIVSNFVRLLRPRDNIHGEWLYLLTRSAEIQRMVWPHTAGSAIPNLSSSFYSAATISYRPSLPEQRLIAQILDTLDTQIRRTEGVIAKLEQVKQGLLTDLFTRGIDENGELRPPPEEAPHLYKDCPLGTIPRDWEVAKVADVGAIVTGATPPSEDPNAWGDTTPFVTPGDIGYQDQVDRAERALSKRGLSYVRELPTGSTLVVCIGSTLGKVGLSAVSMATNQQINAVIPNEEYDFRFLFLAVRAHVRQILNWAGLQAVPIINKSTFGYMLIPIAHLSEQRKIAEIANKLDERLAKEKAVKQELDMLKKGLMDDLLTGRVRVTPLLEEAKQATV